MKKRVFGFIFIIAIFATMLGLIIANAQYIFTSEQFYTQTDLEQKYDEGYNQGAFDNRDENLYDLIDSINSENFDLKTQIENDKVEIGNLQTKVDDLEVKNAGYLDDILDLKSQVEVLESKNQGLEEDNQKYSDEISALKEKISEYADLIYQNDLLINELEITISNLQTSIDTYEEFISGLETDNEVYAIFVVKNVVSDIQFFTKGSLILKDDPILAENEVFNGWYANNELVDLDTFYINANTTFIASITTKYNVNFEVDDTSVYDEIVVENGCISKLPDNPVKNGYKFMGWSFDGVNIIENINSYKITHDTTFIAVFEEIFTVKFVVEDENYSTQSIVKFDSPTLPEEPVKTNYRFLGWSVDGVSIISDIENYEILKDTTFTAIFEEVFYTISFINNSETISTQVVHNASELVIPSVTADFGYTFKGWKNSFDSYYYSSSNIDNCPVDSDGTFIAYYEEGQSISSEDYSLEVTQPIYSSSNFKVSNEYTFENEIAENWLSGNFSKLHVSLSLEDPFIVDYNSSDNECWYWFNSSRLEVEFDITKDTTNFSIEKTVSLTYYDEKNDNEESSFSVTFEILVSVDISSGSPVLTICVPCEKTPPLINQTSSDIFYVNYETIKIYSDGLVIYPL